MTGEVFNNETGRKLMKCAIENGDVAWLDYLLKMGVDPDGEIDGVTIWGHFTYGFPANAPDIGRLLINAGISINSNNACCGSGLHAACLANNLSVVQMLLEMGADPNIINTIGQSPLVVARNIEIIRALLKANASPNIGFYSGKSALTRACILEAHEEIEMLLNAGADPDIQDANGYTTLIQVCRHAVRNKNAVDIVRILLDRKASIDKPDNYGCTPLMHAIREDRLEIVQLLLNRNADFHLKNSKGSTAYRYAASNKNKDIIQIFKSLRLNDTLTARVKKAEPDELRVKRKM